MGNWNRVRTEAANQYLAVNTIEIDLPVSNFIGAVWVRMNGLGGATPVTVNLMGVRVRAEIVADGSKVIYNQTLRMGQQIVHYKHGVVPELATAGAAGATDFTLPIIFGRFLGDLEYILPAKLYKTLKLRLTFGVVLNANTDLFAATGAALEVDVDQWIGADDPNAKKVLKTVELESHLNAAAIQNVRFEFPLQGQIAKVYVHGYTTATGVAAAITTSRELIVNSANTIWSGLFADTVNFNLNPNTYVDNGVHVIDLDRNNLGGEAINMRGLGKFEYNDVEAAVAGTVVTAAEFIMNANEV